MKWIEESVRDFFKRMGYRTKWNERCVICGKYTDKLMIEHKDLCTPHLQAKFIIELEEAYKKYLSNKID